MRVGIALLTVLSGLWLTGCAANPAQDKPQATVNTPSAQATTAVRAASDVLPIRPDSTIGFVGSKVTGSHQGGFKSFEGAVYLVEQNPEKSSVEVTIHMDSTFADDPDLTDHLLSPDFFDVEKFPTSTFKSTRIARSGDGYQVTGDFTLHGVTKSISFPARIAEENGTWVTTAEFSIKRFDWKIMYPGKADNLIRDEVLIQLDLKAGGSAPGADEATPPDDGSTP
ncbi:MAG: YceI family protein [Candidatus Eremiobacterota bacterium]